MGRATIKAHLGDAHYRIALEVDVTYAKRQYDEHTAYLEAFEPKLQAAKDARDELKLAFDAAGVALHDYLTPKREAAEAAYTAMTNAYDAWLAAFMAWDPGADQFFRDSLNAATTAFFDAHARYVRILKGEAIDGWTLETAEAERTARQGQWVAAQGDWYGSLAYVDDPAACNDAYDLLGVAISDFTNATIAFAADPGNPTLESAMDYYQGEVQSAQSAWVSVVTDNSGDAYIARLRANYDAAAATFEAAQQELSVTLADGSVAPGILEKWQAMSEAEARWRNADREYREMLLAKTERVKQRAELWNRLQHHIGEDGNPIEQLVNAWCADASEELAPGTAVATVEIPGERYIGVRVRPGYRPEDYAYTAARDGQLQPSWASSPEATFYNWAIHPGGQRWRPNYRLGVITAVDPAHNTCTVRLDPQKNSPSSKGYDSASATLDVNNPVKYVIDPDTGDQEAVLPGPNVQVADGVTTLLNVEIQYMECHAEAFATNDHVLVEFISRSWTQPRVIGFAEQPKPCATHGVVMGGWIHPAPGGGAGADYDGTLLRPTPHGTAPALVHRGGAGTLLGGNIDWTSADGKTVLTWDGPLGRNLPQRMLIQNNYGAADSLYEYGHYTRAFRLADMGNWSIGLATRWGRSLYRNGKLLATCPEAYYILGAGLISYTDPEHPADRHDYVVWALAGSWYLDWTDEEEDRNYVYDLWTRPQLITNTFQWARLTGGTLGPWTTFHTADLSAETDAMPPLHIYAISPSGGKLATLVPTLERGQVDGSVRFAIGRYALVTADLSASAEGVALGNWAYVLTGSQSGSYSRTRLETWGDVEVGRQDYTTSVSGHESSSATGYVGVDFAGETLAVLSGASSYSSLETSEGAGTVSEGDPLLWADASTGTVSANASHTLTDAHRSATVGLSQWLYSQSSSNSVASMVITTQYSVDQSETNHMPVWYDLRTGAGIYLVAGAQSSHSQSEVASYTPGDDYPRRDASWTDSASGALTLRDGFDVDIVTTAPMADSTSGSGSGNIAWIDFGTFWGGFRPVGETSSASSGYVPHDSTGNQCAVPWVREYGGYPSTLWLGVPQVYAQATNSTGDAVVYADHALIPDALGGRYLTLGLFHEPPDEQRLHAAHATGFDLTTAWQAHLTASHPPADPEAPADPLPTALESELRPLFKV